MPEHLVTHTLIGLVRRPHIVISLFRKRKTNISPTKRNFWANYSIGFYPPSIILEGLSRIALIQSFDIYCINSSFHISK